MSEEEVESFEITDYDLENEFNINRKQRRPTKHQNIYGIWADNDSGDEGPSNRRPSFKKGPKKAYTAPVSFIAGGIQQAGKPKQPAADGRKGGGDDNEDEEEDEDNEQRAALGRRSSSSSEDDLRPSFMGATSFMEGDIAGMRKKSFRFDDTLAKKGVGNWEKHTKGIGAKLLLQMGYQPGRGLGKDLQGIQAPVEAHVRKGRGAIGAYGPEKRKVIAEKSLEKVVDDGDKGKGSEAKISQWRKDGGTSKKKKVQYVYKSIEDVLEQSKHPTKGRREFSELSKVKVIDMTGPEQRILSGYHAISGVQKPSDQWEIRKEKKFTNFELPELQHNLNLLVDMCEEAIVQNNKDLTYADDRSVALEGDLENLKKIEVQEAQTIDTLEKVLNIVETLTEKSENNTLTLDMAAEAFVELQEKYYSEYCAYEVQALAIGVVRPLLKDYLSSWQPLQNPELPMEIFKKWKNLLEIETTFPYAASPQDPYQRLIWDAWMPCIRIAVNAWNCRKCDPMLEFLNVWIPMIPPWTLDNILNQLILPRIQHDVEEWNPLTDTVPIHTWIHPWLPHIGPKAFETTVFPIIRHKLSVALVSWHPSDPSARLMLQPWAKVFNKGEMDAFLVNNILPKLHLALQEFIINPHQQHLEMWNWVMDWSDLFPVHTMTGLLDKSFFPKWLQVLTLWLNLNPNYDQVTNWYQGWKGMISDKLQAEPVIQEHFNTALNLMSRSVGGGTGSSKSAGPVAPVPPPPQPLIDMYPTIAECSRSSAQVPHGFKELVEKRCEERGILWVPVPNLYREAKQVYKCGTIRCYVDRNVLFACDHNGIWSPISLQQLLDRAVKFSK